MGPPGIEPGSPAWQSSVLALSYAAIQELKGKEDNVIKRKHNNIFWDTCPIDICPIKLKIIITFCPKTIGQDKWKLDMEL